MCTSDRPVCRWHSYEFVQRNFEATVPILDEVYVVAMNDDAGVAYNALIFDRVLPIPE